MSTNSASFADLLKPSPYNLCSDATSETLWHKFITSVQHKISDQALMHITIQGFMINNYGPSMSMNRARAYKEWDKLEKEIFATTTSHMLEGFVNRYVLKEPIKFKVVGSVRMLPFHIVTIDGSKNMCLDTLGFYQWCKTDIRPVIETPSALTREGAVIVYGINKMKYVTLPEDSENENESSK